MVGLASKSRHHAIIVGEPGTGKTSIARAIHRASATGTVFVVDCADPFASLVHRELFGYRRGNDAWVEGALVQADAAIILRSLPDWSMFLQRRLASALRGGFLPRDPQPVDVRARIFATVHWREELVESVSSDLKTELGRFVIDVPALSERSEDIPAIASAIAEELGCEISERAMAALVNYRWPGNMHELQTCLQRAGRVARARVIDAGDLPEEIAASRGEHAATAGGHRASVRTLADAERDAIVKAIGASQGNKVTAARLLGIGKTTLYRKLREYQLGESSS
jgi:two-component system response regulator HydG